VQGSSAASPPSPYGPSASPPAGPSTPPASHQRGRMSPAGCGRGKRRPPQPRLCSLGPRPSSLPPDLQTCRNAQELSGVRFLPGRGGVTSCHWPLATGIHLPTCCGLASARPPPRSRHRHRRRPQPPGSRAGSARAAGEGPRWGGAWPGAGPVDSRWAGLGLRRACRAGPQQSASPFS
jgi:hypothetical protein